MAQTAKKNKETDRRTAGPVVEVRDLRQRYGDFEAVKGISFEIRPGELFGLLGTNGAGKTTTIETLEGFRRPSAGTVRVFGVDPYGQPSQIRERANAVLQGSGLFDDLTVRETLDFTVGLASRPRDAAELLETVGMAHKADTMVRQLSGGEKRRLDLASALVTRPEVLYLDEPTTGMDPEGRRDTWKIISDLKEQGTAILLTTHYLDEVEQLADRLAIMHRGEIRVEGTIGSVLAEYGDHIGFRVPAGVRSGDLPTLSGERPGLETRDGHLHVSYTVRGEAGPHRAYRALAPLVEWARDNDLELADLQVRGVTLEDVFLRIADEGDE
ncbi:ABC transporter ATP-binding protein [Nocardiopsis sp. NPDC006139]|uniref:ABC transporter ATP-binding protein n=1 Tax=unclassified Nocardiopsis TaxID=2649073 RepID=UPI00159726EE|nr:ABC transporter ATP-binding protein [Nocardiopsis flavescens]